MIRVVLRPGEDRRIKSGHLWVFSNEVSRVEPDPGVAYTPGCQASLVTASGEVLGWGYYNRSTLIAFRLLSREPERGVEELLRERLKQALEFRARVMGPENCYRLVHSEGDLLPGLVVDRYGDHLVVQTLTAGMAALQPVVVKVLVELVGPRAIVMRNDAPIRSLEGLPAQVEVAHGEVQGPIEATIDGLTFQIDLLSGQKTGFFLDQRENRLTLGRYVKNAQVLDVFSYQGVWGLYALKSGATSVLAVDSSHSALTLARSAAEANGLADRFDTRVGEAFAVLKDLFREGRSFGVVVVDPPSFAKSKKDLKQARIAYERVNKLAIRLLGPGGILATSSCSYHMPSDEFLRSVLKAVISQGRRARLLELRGQAVDHSSLLSMPEGSYLKCAFLEIL